MHSMRTYVLAIVVVAALVLTGCARQAAPFTFAGDWTGTMDDPVFGEGTLAFTLAQDGNDLTGSWSLAFPGGVNASGEAIGEFLPQGDDEDEDRVQIAFFVDQTPCTYVASGRLDGTTVSGTYQSFGCNPNTMGSFSATKQ
jgi:hypothetical protein